MKKKTVIKYFIVGAFLIYTFVVTISAIFLYLAYELGIGRDNIQNNDLNQKTNYELALKYAEVASPIKYAVSPSHEYALCVSEAFGGEERDFRINQFFICKYENLGLYNDIKEKRSLNIVFTCNYTFAVDDKLLFLWDVNDRVWVSCRDGIFYWENVSNNWEMKIPDEKSQIPELIKKLSLKAVS